MDYLIINLLVLEPMINEYYKKERANEFRKNSLARPGFGTQI